MIVASITEATSPSCLPYSPCCRRNTTTAACSHTSLIVSKYAPHCGHLTHSFTHRSNHCYDKNACCSSCARFAFAAYHSHQRSNLTTEEPDPSDAAVPTSDVIEAIS